MYINFLDLDAEHIIYLMNAIFMFLNFLQIFLSSFKIRPNKRIFHFLLSHISIMSFVSYFMLTNDVLTIYHHDTKIYNARYLDWIVNTPVQLIILGLMGNLSLPNIYILCLLDIVMIMTGWIGELSIPSLKLWFFSIGIIAVYPIYVFLYEDFDFETVKEFSGEYIASRYYWTGRYLLMTWLFYPIVWILQNLKVIPFLYGCILYTILDFFAKIVFIRWVYICVYHSNKLKDDDGSPVGVTTL